MAADRTFVTEIATGLGMLDGDSASSIVARRPREFINLTDSDWSRLESLSDEGSFRSEFEAGFENGRAFLNAHDALRGRPPRLIEWTGERHAPGDEVVPSDLRVDHVYLISCKYLSRILHNPSPARLVEGLLTQAPVDDLRDWYQRFAPDEYQELYETCARSVGDPTLPQRASDLTHHDRRRLALTLRGAWSAEASEVYGRLCTVISRVTAAEWKRRVTRQSMEPLVWRLLRIGSAPYFILGTNQRGSMRLRIDTPWDWRQAYRLRGLDVDAQAGGQPRVRWEARYQVLHTSEERTVHGHVEIRWSHGRFGQPPEAKVYLDTDHEDVPGYNVI